MFKPTRVYPESSQQIDKSLTKRLDRSGCNDFDDYAYRDFVSDVLDIYVPDADLGFSRLTMAD